MKDAVFMLPLCWLKSCAEGSTKQVLGVEGGNANIIMEEAPLRSMWEVQGGMGHSIGRFREVWGGIHYDMVYVEVCICLGITLRTWSWLHCY